MNRFIPALVVALALAPAVSPAHAQAAGSAVVTPVADVKWLPGPVPGVSIAPVNGDMTKGPSHFFLKYDAGFAAPVHYHSPDHYVTVVSGTLVLTMDGKEHVLAPGSFCAMPDKAKHAARVDGKEACVMFIDARGPWDAVMDEASGGKK